MSGERTGRVKVIGGSPLHRVFGITPGFAPPWLCSHSSCGGVDVTVAALVAVSFAAFAWGMARGWGWELGVPAVWGACYLAGAFWDRERLGRARRRRGECVWCGRADTAAGTRCTGCGRSK